VLQLLIKHNAHLVS